MAALLSQISINLKHVEFENISVNQIWNLRTVWWHVDCRPHIFSLLFERNFRNMFKRHYLKTENILHIFYWIFTIYAKFCTFRKNRSASSLKNFRIYWLREMWLLECTKVPVSERPSTVYVFSGVKHCWNEHGSTFIWNFH